MKTAYSLTMKVTPLVVREATGEAIRSSSDIAKRLADLSDSAQECFVVVTVNTKNKIVDRHLVFMGSLAECIVHPREVFRHAIIDGASSIFVVHNHPSGDPTPSGNDMEMHRRLTEAGQILGIPVLDSLIIGKGKYYSFFEMAENMM